MDVTDLDEVKAFAEEIGSLENLKLASYLQGMDEMTNNDILELQDDVRKIKDQVSKLFEKVANIYEILEQKKP